MFSTKKIILAITLILVGVVYLSSTKFNEETLHTIIAASTELPEQQRLNFIVQKLHETYGTIAQPKFYLFNGGSAHGIIGMLYASLSEYLIIYGTPLNNSGHSGRYLMTVRDFIYRGKVRIASPHHLDGREVLPGELTTLPWGSAHHYLLEPHTWMIEYGHGLTLTAMPFMMLSLLTTGDIVGVGALTWAYAKQVVKNLLSLRV